MRSSRIASAVLMLALLFAGGALFADAALTRLLLRSESAEAGRIGRLIEGADNQEIPIFGASKAMADYIPSVLGERFYNYGFYSASPDVTSYLVGFEVRKRSDSPIIVDLHQGAFSDIGDVRNYLPFARLHETKELLERANKWRWYYKVPGLRYFGSYDWYVRGVALNHSEATKVFDRGYARELNAVPWDRATFDGNVRQRLAEPFSFGIDPRQEQVFLRSIRQAPQRTFVIVLSPLHESFLAHATGEEAFRYKLQEMAQEPNVRILDFTRTAYPDRYFRDTGHLNYTGALAFSGELREQLKALGIGAEQVSPD